MPACGKPLWKPSTTPNRNILATFRDRSFEDLSTDLHSGGRTPILRLPIPQAKRTKSPMFNWDHPTMLAPMEGVTHPTFRAMMAQRGGIGMLCTEFVRIAGEKVSDKHMAKQVDKVDGVPLSVQVMGTHTELMADAAAAVARAGADVVDINLGCPAPRVVKKGAGSAMLKNPDLLFEILSAMRDVVPGLLSAKIRAGFDEASNVVAIAQTVERAGADFIAVHPRRRADFYEGVADWRIIRLLKQELSIPVVGNGDIWYAADALRMMDETGCDAVMLGRPACRNPWIFEQIEALRAGRTPVEPDGAALVDWLLEIVEVFSVAFPRKGRGPLGKVKEMVTYLGRAVDDGGAFRRDALRLQSIEEIVALAEGRVRPLSAERIDLDAFGRIGLEQSGSALGAA